MTHSNALPLWRYLIAYLLGTVFFLYAFIQRVSPSVMTEEWMRDFAIGGAGIGILSGMYFYSYAAIQLPVGIMIDRFGPRKLMSVSASICALASLAFAYSDSLMFASMNRVLIGGTVAFAFVGTLSIASLFFPARRFALLTGILMSVGMIGAIVGQAPLRYLLELSGWRFIYLLLALFALVLGLCIWLAVPRRPAQYRAASRAASLAAAPAPAVFSGLRGVVANRDSWYCAIIGFGSSATMLAFGGLWSVPWLTTTVGLTNTTAAAIASTMFAGVALSSPFAGWLSDTLGRRKPILTAGMTVLFVALVVIVYGGVTAPWALTLLFLMAGLGTGTMGITFGLSKELNEPAHSATAMGFINMWVVGSGAVMQPLIGWMLDRQWTGELISGARVYTNASYQWAFCALIVSVAAAIVCTLLVREPLSGATVK